MVERYACRGGVEGIAYQVSRHLAEAGEDVHVVCRVDETPGPTAGNPGPKVHALGGPSGWQPLRVLAFSRAAGTSAARLGLDVVLSFSRTRHQQVFRAGGGCHAAYMERAYPGAAGRLRRFSPRHAVLLAMERQIFADPGQTILCNSEMVAGEIAERHAVPRTRLRVLPNAVDLERFHPDRRGGPEPAALRARLGVDGSGPVWLLVGDGFRRKGVDTAIRALAHAPDREAHLWVVGGDDPTPYRRLAGEAGVADRVDFLGRRSDPETVYAAADALVLPTRYDAFANVCLEAAAAGLPVVTSGANGAAGFLGDAALVVASPEDAAGFGAALVRLGDPAERAAFGARARARAETAAWDRYVADLRGLLHEAAP